MYRLVAINRATKKTQTRGHFAFKGRAVKQAVALDQGEEGPIIRVYECDDEKSPSRAMVYPPGRKMPLRVIRS